MKSEMLQKHFIETAPQCRSQSHICSAQDVLMSCANAGGGQECPVPLLAEVPSSPGNLLCCWPVGTWYLQLLHRHERGKLLHFPRAQLQVCIFFGKALLLSESRRGELFTEPSLSSVFCSVIFFAVLQSLSHVQLIVTPWTAAYQASLSITNFQSWLKLMSMESVMPSNHLILCRPLLLPPSIFPSIRVFSHESALRIRGPKYWSFSCSISPSNEYSGLISFRMDWLDLLAVQGTLESLFQHFNSKASILQYSTFFIVQSHICT